MSSRRFRTRCASGSWPLPIRYVCSAVLVGGLILPGAAVAQDEAVVDEIANILLVEDARRFDAAVLTAGARATDPIVRRRAAMALGRIGSPAGLDLLVELTTDQDSTVQRDAAFALGLLGDTTGVPALRRLLTESALDADPAVGLEAVSALARIGGADAATAVIDVLQGAVSRLTADGDTPALGLRAVQEAWRLGERAPVSTLVQLADAPNLVVRRAAVHALFRLRAPEAGAVLLTAVRDEDAAVRKNAVRTLSATYADSSGLGRGAVGPVLVRAMEDDDIAVRIQALRALATYGDSTLAGAALDQLTDPSLAVQTEALLALGRLGGGEAAEALRGAARGGEYWVGRAALLGLARVDRAQAIRITAGWITGSDWRRRHAGAEALAIIGGDTALAWLESLVDDPDERVVGRAYESLIDGDSVAASEFARALLRHQDPVVRTLAANQVARAPTVADLPALADAYRLSLSDPIPDAAIAVVEALGALASRGPSQAFAVEDRFLAQVPTCDDYLVRRAAEEHLPAAAERWGPAFPVETGRSLEDYREIARRLVLPAELDGERPGLLLETDRGSVEIELYAEDAPLTVTAILELVDRGYFNGHRWHRVVPDFVVQDGDPRGDGWGGPGFSMRDEVNRRRYDAGTIGMALSGPDTGGSQFFITLSPQPHLDGIYTVFGTVGVGMDIIQRTVLTDRIRAVRRR